MNGSTSKADAYRDAYRAINHREATVTEVNAALNLTAIVEDTGIDPFLLSTITSADFLHLQAEALKALPEVLGTSLGEVMGTALAEIKAAIPTGGEVANQIRELTAFEANLSSSVDAHARLSQSIALTRIIAGPVLFSILGVLLLAMLSFSWFQGRGQGLEARSITASCKAIANVYSIANRDRHAETKRDLDTAWRARGCTPEMQS